MEEVRISFEELQHVLKNLFLDYNFTIEEAKLLAKVHAESTLDGVYSHGINRVPVFLDYVRRGLVHIEKKAEKITAMGSVERWDGNLGSGILNAITCTNRAISLAKEHGMGMVALRNTNHWMRGGTYGWQAAEEGCIAIMFTNTTPNMPAWGGRDNRLGNNPLVIAIPRKEGNVVLDMALSQFSFGKMERYHLKGEQLPFHGGWDGERHLSTDPKAITDSGRALPSGYWKGSALSMVLDMLATLLSAGNSTYKIGQKKDETAISQVFLCIAPGVFEDSALQDRLLDEIINYTHDVAPMTDGSRTYYPGEQTMQMRAKNLKEGITVNSKIWNEIISLRR